MAAFNRSVARVFVLVFLALTLMPRAVSAQVSSTTAAIVGAAVDSTKGVLPGVTVTATGPALMGSRTVVTGPDGAYRIPALPPGNDYKLVFELVGFQTITREGIQIGVGFTATINAEMSPAGLAEDITVSGASPVVDVTSSEVTTHLNAQQITGALVGSRDYAALMAQLPGVLHMRVDVAGSNATTMQAFRAYGLQSGRGELEGINSSQFGSMGLVAYTDTESFDDMAIHVVGAGAEMAQPGAFVNVVSKSGGNSYHGQYYLDFQDKSMGTTNIDDALIARGLQGSAIVSVRELNTFKRFRDVSANLGGYLVKDKVWWFGALRHTMLSRAYPVLIDDIATTTMPVYTGKLTYNATPNNKLTGYYTNTIKRIENYGVGTAIVTADTLTDERYPIGLYSFGYEALFGHNAVLSIHAGHWGDNADYRGKGQNQRYTDAGLNRIYGSISTRNDQRDRPQVNGNLNYFKTGWMGSHNFKFGGEFQHEQQRYSTSVFNNLYLYLNNNVPTFVEVYLSPNRTRAVGRNVGAYVSDSWRLSSRFTANLGVRFDRYRNYVPAQVGPQGHQFPQIEGPLWNTWAPRLGIVYALTQDGRTLVKASFGRYWENPGWGLSAQFNPNPNNNYTRYNWINPNPIYNSQGLPIYEGPHQLGSVVSVQGARADFQPAVTPDPNLKDQLVKQTTVYFEREVAANFGVRTGFVWNGIRNQRATVNINWPYTAFNQPVTVADLGPDGRVGTADDGAPVTAYNLDSAYRSLPVVQMIKNGILRDTDYYTWEITANKRLSNRWALLASFSNMWSHEGQTIATPNELINTTDGRDYYSEWQVRVSSTLILPRGIELTPLYRGQAGAPFAPTFQTRLNYSTVTIKAKPRGEQRADNTHVFDIRAQKVFKFGQKSLRGFVDVYNVFNTNAVQQQTTSYGANYLRPSLISGPRIARVGVRFEF